MMSRTVTTYPKHYVEISARYNCKCGHKFYRKNRDWFTINPLNHDGYNTSRKNLINKLKNKERDCPKCGATVKAKAI